MRATPETGAARQRSGRVTWPRVLSSEWGKLWTLRSTAVVYGAAASLMLAFGLAAVAVSGMDTGSGAPPPELFADPTHLTLSGVALAQLPVALAGVLFVTGEFATGHIRSTLLAVPRRIPVLTAKAVVLFSATVAVTVPVAALCFFAARPMLEEALGFAWPVDGHVVRALFGAGLYLGAIGVMGLGVGALVRSTAVGITVMVGVLYLVPMLSALLPSGWDEKASVFMPTTLGSKIMEFPLPDSPITPANGFMLFCCYVALVFLPAIASFKRGDVN
ncbi:hypothetical protein J0910_30245 [Nocardiopsis sp. CNT-189]|uniref:hypothetical protein n=1 Tax=Nocardiopsis oceanisediminis TaxID=2816862 RepID=UPI003B2E1A57